jgi:mRNA interferase MazF
MGRFVKGDVVVTPFPFSDLQAAKRRPALVVATFTGEDVLLCQITSQAVSDSYAIPLRSTDFTSGRLANDSNIRPNRLFTTDSHHSVPCWGPEARETARGDRKNHHDRQHIAGEQNVPWRCHTSENFPHRLPHELHCAEQGPGADCPQRPLHSCFRQQLRPGVTRLSRHSRNAL